VKFHASTPTCVAALSLGEGRSRVGVYMQEWSAIVDGADLAEPVAEACVVWVVRHSEETPAPRPVVPPGAQSTRVLRAGASCIGYESSSGSPARSSPVPRDEEPTDGQLTGEGKSITDVIHRGMRRSPRCSTTGSGGTLEYRRSTREAFIVSTSPVGRVACSMVRASPKRRSVVTKSTALKRNVGAPSAGARRAAFMLLR
jgi:hypothetical protein